MNIKNVLLDCQLTVVYLTGNTKTNSLSGFWKWVEKSLTLLYCSIIILRFELFNYSAHKNNQNWNWISCSCTYRSAVTNFWMLSRFPVYFIFLFEVCFGYHGSNYYRERFYRRAWFLAIREHAKKSKFVIHSVTVTRTVLQKPTYHN